MFDLKNTAAKPLVWQVGALCRAIADALAARFNPVTVRGELSGVSMAASGHCYFTLRDTSRQLRCAMFKRAASGLAFVPRDGELVEVTGKLGVYEPRGDLQLIVESMSRAGLGSLFEQFVLLKAKLEAEGLFETSRKRPLPVMPRAIGLVTSLGAAALHDVVTTLQRRLSHIPVVLAPASVQGAQAAKELVRALSNLYQLTQSGQEPEAAFPYKKARGVATPPPVDVILLVRGGGAIEDLWSFNDEQLARVIATSPVPVVCGVGHETDFTIADFVADLRAPTPTAAAELVAQPRDAWLSALDLVQRRLQDALLRHLDRQSQRLDTAVARLGRPSALLAAQRLRLSGCAQTLQHATRQTLQVHRQQLQRLTEQPPLALKRGLQATNQRLERATLRLSLLDPQVVLQRGYAWLSDEAGCAITRTAQTHAGQRLAATLMDGTVDLIVTPQKTLKLSKL